MNARKKKHEDKVNEEYWAKVSAPPVFQKYSPDELMGKVKTEGKRITSDFSIDGLNEKVFMNLCNYFTGSSGELSLSKGLFLVGVIGCGKTTMMRLFADNQQQSYRIISCREITYQFSKNGFEEIEKYSVAFENWDKSKHYGQKFIGCCFDDMGTEDLKKYFGNESNVMQEIILNRYDKCERKLTHITTNLTAKQITENYGARVGDRMREMFNIIEFPKQESRRK